MMTSLISIAQDIQVLGWREVFEMFLDIPLRSYNLDGCVCVFICLLWYIREERELEKRKKGERERERVIGGKMFPSGGLVWCGVYAYLLRCPYGVSHLAFAGYISILGILCGEYILFPSK